MIAINSSPSLTRYRAGSQRQRGPLQMLLWRRLDDQGSVPAEVSGFRASGNRFRLKYRKSLGLQKPARLAGALEDFLK
jgi:hypothetical protein